MFIEVSWSEPLLQGDDGGDTCNMYARRHDHEPRDNLAHARTCVNKPRPFFVHIFYVMIELYFWAICTQGSIVPKDVRWANFDDIPVPDQTKSAMRDTCPITFTSQVSNKLPLLTEEVQPFECYFTFKDSVSVSEIESPSIKHRTQCTVSHPRLRTRRQLCFCTQHRLRKAPGKARVCRVKVAPRWPLIFCWRSRHADCAIQ